jgi:hypothetical protein
MPPSPSRAQELGAARILPNCARRCESNRPQSGAYRGPKNLTGEKVMELRIHLKVCEGCGCLWYRTQVETRVYCTQCENRFKEFPAPQKSSRRGRPRKTTLATVYAVQSSLPSANAGDCLVAPEEEINHALLSHSANPSMCGAFAGGAL